VIDRYQQLQGGCPDVKEATKIGSNIIIRTVDHECQRSSRLLQGEKKPLDLIVEGAAIEVLEMSFSHPMGEANEHLVRANLYARTNGAVSAGVARALLSQVRATTGAEDIGVDLRSDSWFIEECGFPALYPFENLPKAPRVEEFYRTSYASCGLFGTIRCFEGRSHR
jgi:hypothetical protein